MSRPVLLYNGAVIHGNFRGAIREIGRRITASRHHSPEKLIRLHECARRIVHKLSLDRPPRLLEPVAIRRGKRA